MEKTYLNLKRETKKWLNKAIDEGPYEFKEFALSVTEAPRMQKEEDLRGADLKHYEAEIEAMNLILIYILNDIYNAVDACTTAKAMWERVERLMRGTVQNKVDRETRFNNEFDQLVVEPRETLVSVYNGFAQLMNDLERNGITFPKVTINTKFLNCLKPEWLKYVTQVRDTVQNNSDYPLTSVMILLARAITRNFSTPTNNRLHTSSNTRNQAIVQEEVIEGTNVQNDDGNIQRTLRTSSSGTAANFKRYNYSEKDHYACNYPKPHVRDSNVEEDNNIQQSYALEQLASNAYKEAEKQQIIAKHTEDILEDATKSQIKIKNKMKDLVAIKNKQNVCTIDYNRLNSLYDDFVPQKELFDERKYFPSSFMSSEDPLSESSPYSSSKTKPTKKSMPSANPILVDLNQMENNFKKWFKFLRDIKEMKDVFDSTESDLSATWKQHEFLKDQLLEATLKHEIECCVLLSRECVDNNMQDEIEKVQRDSVEIQKGMQKWINILENDVQRWEINELFENVEQNTYAYADVYAQHQDLLLTISELKAKLKTVENVTLQTSTPKQQAVGINKNVIAPEMYKVGMKQATNTNKAKSVLSSTGLSTNFSVRRPLNWDSSFKNSVTSNIKNFSKKVEVSDMTNKKQDVASTNIVLNTIVTNDEIKNAVIVKNIVDSGCSKHMTSDRSMLKTFIEKFKGTVRFGNDHAAITGYGDYVQGNITICHVYYVEGLGHNLFSVGQLYDSDLEVAFRLKTCYVQNLEGDDLLTGDLSPYPIWLLLRPSV
nr:integrase, catalytic region, zinc finger, CCHC-type, peptidase aspartic, catalytic [Tanacetum cinerariifolium]